MLLLITLLGPIKFLGGTADALKWAHCISGCCYRLLCFGQLYFWKALPMYSDGPMALVDAATDVLAWTDDLSGRRCIYTQMGPLHWQMLLRLPALWLMIYLLGTSDSLIVHHCI